MGAVVTMILAVTSFSPPAAVAAPGDLDDDGIMDIHEDANTDGDNNPATMPGPDTDGDTFPNYLDADDDGDGIPTVLENADPNGDGDPRDARDIDRDGESDYLDIPTAPADGTVSDEQKISDTVGGFGGVLDDSDEFGFSVSAIGDVDGDGVVDMAAGAWKDDDGGADRGAVYVMFMNADGTVRGQQKISDTVGGFSGVLDDGDAFGSAATAIGDVDGDGVVDIAVGAPNDDDGGSNRGAVYVLFMNVDGTVRGQQKISDTVGGFGGVLDDNDYFGYSASGVGDVDGDGVADLAVSAYNDGDGGSIRGAVYVVFLNADGTVKAEQKISSTQGGLTGPLEPVDYFGWSVSGLGDIDGDGVADMAVGAIGDDDGGTDRGAVYVVFLNADGTVRAEQKINDIVGGFNGVLDDSDFFGASVAGVGDVDGDGVADMAVGVRFDDDGGADRGAVYVMFMNADGTVKAEQKISDTVGGFNGELDGPDAFGWSVSGVGDVDGDGSINLAVGARADDDGGVNRGAVYMLDLTIVSPTVTVNSTGEDSDVSPGDGVCETATPGQCTLRAAIEEANASAWVDRIEFDIPASDPGHSSGVWTFAPTTAFPPLTRSVTVDGSTQTGFVANTNPAPLGLNGTQVLVIDGSSAPVGSDGFWIQAADIEIRGFAIGEFQTPEGYGIQVDADRAVIAGNYVSTDVTGTVAAPTAYGVSVTADQAMIGGSDPADRNLISGQDNAGVLIQSGDGTQILGNLINTNAGGDTELIRFGDGIQVWEATNLRIGSGTAGNVIGGFSFAVEADADDMIIENNLIGTVDGYTVDIGGYWSLALFGDRLLLVDNVIGNWERGVRIEATDAVVIGNTIGTDPTGTIDLGMAEYGISVDTSTATIGGDSAADANIVAFNGGSGLETDPGVNPTVLGNRFYSNGGLGIDIETDGITVNSNVDTVLNHPVISAVTSAAGTTTIDFTFDVPAGDYRIEAFSNPSGPDSSGNGEGEVLETAATITHTGSGPEPFQLSFSGALPDRVALTATERATGPIYGATSEFSTTTVCGDSDGDGLLDCEEDANTDSDADPSTNPGPDTDGDAIPNYLDPDDDDDGALTSAENADPNGDGDPRDALDSDFDGQPDYLDVPTDVTEPTVYAEQKINSIAGGLTGPLNDDDYFGQAVASIGDIDGDGVNDVAVGADGDDDGGDGEGAVYVLFLNADGSVKSEQKISSLNGGLTGPLEISDSFGESVAGIGDLDGDGVPDLAVGANLDNDGSAGSGAVYVLFLNADGTVKAEQKISHTAGGLAAAIDGDRFGSAVANLGDLDGDGVNDIAVGAIGDSDGGSFSGATYILLLNPDGTVKAEQKISATVGGLAGPVEGGDYFGSALAALGDLDGDGVRDIAVGAYTDDDGGTARGAVYVLFLNADGTVKAEQKISDTSGGLGATLENEDYFGRVASIGDLNQDGITDIAVGAFGDDDGSIMAGAVYVLLLNTDGTVQSTSKISALSGGLTGPLPAGDQFGQSVGALGDLDEDGALDLIVGARYNDDAGQLRGAVYVLRLSPPGCEVDTDGDGLLDCEEDANTDADNDPATNPGPDTDGDTTPNYLDPDDDGDGILTSAENADPNADGDPRDAVDSDRDGQPDYLDLPTIASVVPIADEQKISATTGGLSATLDDSDHFGSDVTAIGDVDGDGVVDMAVGAFFDDDGGNARGAAYVLFMNPDGTVRAEQKISDTAGGLIAPLDDNDFFGFSVAGLGDLDGDGVPDLAVGAYGADDSGSASGAVYVLLLNPDGTVKREQKISSTVGGLSSTPQALDFFGLSVAGLGDVDGDGVVDLAVGASGDDDGGSSRGAVYVLFLNADGTVKAEQKISTSSGGLGPVLDDSDNFGSSVAGVGDLDGDGVVDIAVGARLDDDGGSNRGAVHLLFLNADGTVKAEQKISATAGGFGVALDELDNFGMSLTGVGDLDRDGVVDLVVGASHDDDGGPDRGAVYVLLLNADGTVKAEQKISATAGGLGATLNDSDHFGYSVAGLGDLDGDGTINLAVGAYYDDDGGTNRGAVYVLDLSLPSCVVDSDGDGLWDCQEDANIDADNDPATNLGPDTDGDTLPNYLDDDDDDDGVLTSAENADPNGDGDPRDALDSDRDGQPDYLDRPTIGSAVPIADEQKISATTGGLIPPLLDGDQFGKGLDSIGDIDGDGVVDLGVGVPERSGGGVFVLFMNADGTVRSYQEISAGVGGLGAAIEPNENFGRDVAGLGDLDGDGVPDIAVGSSRSNDGGTWRGAAYVLFLNADGTVKAEQKISSTAGGLSASLVDFGSFGGSVGGIGDLDGDGVVDLAVGNFNDDDGGPSRGAVHILFLNTDGTVKAEQKISDTAGGLSTTLATGGRFGIGVDAIGDIDADGVTDIVVGAGDQNAVFVVRLNTDGTVKGDQRIADGDGGFVSSSSANALLGYGVAGVGDLDQNGIPDIAVGELRNSDGGAGRGALYLVYLNSDGSVAAQTRVSSTTGGLAGPLEDADNFGHRVAGIGDLDGDGTVNIAVAATRDDDGGVDRGAVYILDLDAANRPPTFDQDITTRIDGESAAVTLAVPATDLDLDVLTWSATGLPPGLSIDLSTGDITGTISATAATGSPYNASITVEDGRGGSDTDIFEWTVTDTNQNPVLSPIASITVNEGNAMAVLATATDPDAPADTITYSATGLPAGAGINPVSGAFVWTPTEAQGPGVYTVTVTATDDGTPPLSVSQTFTITVDEVNQRPVLAPIANQTSVEGSSIGLTLGATDPDLPAAALVFGASDLPPGVTLNPLTGEVSGTISYNASSANPYPTTFTVVDQYGATDTVTLDWTVFNTNRAPSITPIPKLTTAEEERIEVAVQATDPDLNTVYYALVGAPAGASIDPVTGVVAWTPSEEQGPGTFTFDVLVTDIEADARETTSPITVTVTETNQSPILAIPPTQGASAGSAFSIGLAATDLDNPSNDLEFLIIDGPDGLTVDPTTGLISWVPDPSLIGDVVTVSVAVVDDGVPALADSGSFDVQVRPPNLAFAVPTARGDTFLTTYGRAIDLDVLGNDDGADLSIIGISQPSNGSATTDGRSIRFVPEPGFAGTVTFVYTIEDDAASQVPASASVIVTVSPPAALAQDDAIFVPAGTVATIGVLDNDTLTEGPASIGVTQPENGTTTIEGGDQVRYQPDPTFVGTDRFLYTVTDSFGSTSTATVTVTVAVPVVVESPPEPGTPDEMRAPSFETVGAPVFGFSSFGAALISAMRALQFPSQLIVISGAWLLLIGLGLAKLARRPMIGAISNVGRGQHALVRQLRGDGELFKLRHNSDLLLVAGRRIRRNGSWYRKVETPVGVGLVPDDQISDMITAYLDDNSGDPTGR